MNNISTRILNFLQSTPSQQSGDISNHLSIGLRTIQRNLLSLEKEGLVAKIGSGKNTKYRVTDSAKLNYQPNLEIDLNEQRLEKLPSVGFNWNIFEILRNFEFSENEAKILSGAKQEYSQKIRQIDTLLSKKEMQRLVIEFSWKSSKIEGNTYSLLETEKLLSENEIQNFKSRAEAQMILNHKEAFDFILENPDYFSTLSPKKIIELHSILTKNLEVSGGFRKSGVGIIGSLYKPLDNQHEIIEAIEKLCDLVNGIIGDFSKAFITSFMIAYIQPFVDGNKRTARMLCNAILFAKKLPLISYRTVTAREYKDSVLIFYEKSSIYLVKQMFIDQIDYFAKNYF